MQNIEFSLLIALLLTVFMMTFYRQVNRYRAVIYIITIIVTAYFVGTKYFDYSVADGLNYRVITSQFQMGILCESLFMIVAFTGCLPREWTLSKQLRRIRAELSVMGCIVGFGELFYYAGYFVSFFNGELSTGRELATVASLVLFALLIPLTLSSLYTVRRHMSTRHWQMLQKTAYLFYFMLLFHIMGLYGGWDDLGAFFSGRHAPALYCYVYIWTAYFVLRIAKYVCDRHMKQVEPEEITDGAQA